MLYSRTDSGLLVAENASADERAVARALKQHDPDLRLVPQGQQQGRTAYKVYRYCGSDRAAEFICFWGDSASGEPWPLSLRLLDKVRELDRNTRSEYLSEDEQNARQRDELAQKRAEISEALVEDWGTRERRSALLPRGPSLRRARSKTSYHETKGPR